MLQHTPRRLPLRASTSGNLGSSYLAHARQRHGRSPPPNVRSRIELPIRQSYIAARRRIRDTPDRRQFVEIVIVRDESVGDSTVHV